MTNSEKGKRYRSTKIGRAKSLLHGYKREDKIYNRGECTLTEEDMYRLWEQCCYWCGETDWLKLGADRLDNSKPHTKENCVCACWKCNTERSIEYLKENNMLNSFTPKSVIQYTLDGEFVSEYETISEASRVNGIKVTNICKCCKGKANKAGGYVWKYK